MLKTAPCQPRNTVTKNCHLFVARTATAMYNMEHRTDRQPPRRCSAFDPLRFHTALQQMQPGQYWPLQMILAEPQRRRTCRFGLTSDAPLRSCCRRHSSASCSRRRSSASASASAVAAASSAVSASSRSYTSARHGRTERSKRCRPRLSESSDAECADMAALVVQHDIVVLYRCYADHASRP